MAGPQVLLFSPASSTPLRRLFSGSLPEELQRRNDGERIGSSVFHVPIILSPEPNVSPSLGLSQSTLAILPWVVPAITTTIKARDHLRRGIEFKKQERKGRQGENSREEEKTTSAR